MEFKCINPNCSERGNVVTVSRVTAKLVGNSLTYNVNCSSCKEPMEDVTKFDGFGHAKRSYKNASKNWFKRYKG